MSEITSGSNVNFSDVRSITSCEELISFLARASELEHALACTYLFAAYSLKNDVSEGGMTEEQATLVRKWRRSLMAAASRHLLNMAQLSALLVAVGGKPQLVRPTFPVAGRACEDELVLEAFSLPLLDHLMAYERWEASITVPGLLSAPDAHSMQGNGSNGNDVGADSQRYMSIQNMYDQISAAFDLLPEYELFTHPSTVQKHLPLLNLGKPLVAVTDRASARAALDLICNSEHADTSSDADTQHVSEGIRAEYTAALTHAQERGEAFELVRPVAKMPGTQVCEGQGERTVIMAPLTKDVASLFNQAYDTMLLMLLRFFSGTLDDEVSLGQLTQATLRLMNTVVRPLGEALTQLPVAESSETGLCAGPSFADRSNGNLFEIAATTLFDERLWQLAQTATKLAVTPGLPALVREATAGLQYLSCLFAPGEGLDGVNTRMTMLRQIQAGMESAIQSSINGPYLVTNADTLTTWLGEPIPVRPMMALCRCGASGSKPFCDGSHASTDFTSHKDPKRVPDRRDTYVGQQVTIFDNRGICAHSGFCTDRLASAFHVGKEPFVTPSGARMDELIRAVRACPSGALSYAITINGKEERDQVDQKRKPAIEVSKDGPYRVTGGIPLKDGAGNDEVRNTGSSREHYSLCRCGHSQNKPFCSGMHWYVNFHDPVPDPDHEPTVFEWAGGLPAFLRLTHLFYEKYVPQDPLISSLFAEMSPDHPERVAGWLSEVFGGPKSYSDVYGGYTRMISQHVGKCITEEQRARWVSLMCQAANDVGLPNDAEFRAAFVSYLEWGSRLAWENSQTNAHPPEHMPMPHWWWACNATPGARQSALAPVKEEAVEPVVLPGPDEVVSFKTHIKPLFRPMDRQSMKFAFDLWTYEDVKKHADSILQRLQKGSMPCDGAWPREKVEVFQRWVESGMQE